MKKINFKKPRFIIPLILLPFIVLFYYIFSTWGGKNNSAASLVQDTTAANELNPRMPGVSNEVTDAALKDKFGAYLEAYKHNKDASALDNIYNFEKNIGETDFSSAYSAEDLKRIGTQNRMDSLQQVLKNGQKDIDRQMAQIYANTRPDKQNKTSTNNAAISTEQLLKELAGQPYQEVDKRQPDSYSEQMKLFRDQMMVMDSIQRSYTEKGESGDKQQSNPKAVTNNFDPTAFDPNTDSIFKPLPVRKNRNNSSAFNTIHQFRPDQAIKAIIDQDGKATAAARIRIRLLSDIFVSDKLIPKGTYLYGIVTGFQTQRVNISITQVMYENEPLPIKLDVFDNDGYLGLYVPGSSFREFTKAVGTQGTQGLSQVRTSDNSNITSGIISQLFQTTSSTVTKLIQKEKAFLKYNYIIYLKQNSNYEK